MDGILEVSHVSKSFGPVRAVDDLSLSVQAGEIFGFLGPNGAGKTTTISMICGLLKADSGEISLNGHNDDIQPHGSGTAAVNKIGKNRTRIGVCPQSIVIWERLTCLESLEFIGEMYAIPRQAAHARGLALLEAFGLEDKRDALAGRLSGGMQRRLNLALALVHDPDLLVLDEPEAGLDPQSRVLVREFIRNWAHERPGRTVIFTTHNMDEAERLVERVGIIDHGRLLVLDTPAALKRAYGQGDVLEMALSGPCEPARLEPALASLAPGGHIRIEWAHLEMRLPSAVEALPQVLAVLKGAGLTPGEVRLRESTLEDVFIHLTGRGLRE